MLVMDHQRGPRACATASRVSNTAVKIRDSLAEASGSRLAGRIYFLRGRPRSGPTLDAENKSSRSLVSLGLG